MADAAGDGSDEHLARARIIDFDFFHREGRIRLTQNRGFDSHECHLLQELSLYTAANSPRASCLPIDVDTVACV
jgi:hypothetical protein